MLYMNDKPMTYQEVVDAVIALGIEPKRAYIYLAGLGIKGVLGRYKLGEIGYGQPVKVAVRDGGFIYSVSACEHCGGITIG